ncbi:MAG: hypothetical protein ACI35V_05335 [Sphingobacterium composti]|uniref:hypothetical protein n=1 Tax=Sphingobacterium composti TaxID=363260 RepID=UPI00135C6CB9|nr:hypothetical protein [Sphingobacterium composti Ten et al. 2007 non Yoo et al. 2007]
MSELSKAKEEKINLDRFLGLLKRVDLKFESFLKEPESDFLLLSGNNKKPIGIELTSLNQEHLKRSEKEIEFILNDAMSEFGAQHPLLKYNLSISFSFDNVWYKDFIFLKKEKQTIVDDLIKVVKHIEIIKSNRQSFTMYKVFQFHNSKFVNWVNVRNANNPINEWYLTGEAGGHSSQNVINNNSISEDLIEKLINKKIDKPFNYNVEYDEIWLLIYAHEGRNSSSFSLDYFDYNKMYKTRYDKVYLMLENKVVLLNTTVL